MALLSRRIWSTLISQSCGISGVSHKHFKSVLTKRKEHFISARWKSEKSRVEQNNQETRTVNNELSGFSSFEEMIETRRSEARKSIVVQVHSEQSCPELYSYCCQFGTVKSMHHYTLPGPSHYVIVEFGKEEDVYNVLHNSGHLDTNQIVPVRSPFLWFRIGRGKMKMETPLSKIPLLEIDGNNSPSNDDLYSWLHAAESVSDQMRILHEETSLTSLGSRLRFLTALQIEQALSGPFPRIKAYPFGSTVNSFGKMNCDLDLVLELDKEEASSDCRLIFHAKNSLTNGRTQVQRHMETIGDICQLFLPGCANVRRILQARVPIVKYRQELTGVECDLSMTNMSAVYMSELLFVLGSVDKRVRPLVQAVRTWARDVGLTNPTPGRWITNFSLTLLVLFYLQQSLPHPVIPTFNKLISMASAADKIITTEGVNCTFVRDLKAVKKYMDRQPKNTELLEDLLLKFFEYYCTFDFGSHAISLATGTPIPKPEHAALYIVNPLERGLNVSKNVSLEELERLRIEFRNAAWALEAYIKQPTGGGELWGLVAICQAPKLQAKGKNVFYIPPKLTEKPRRFNVQELFEEDLNVKDVHEKSSVMTNLTDSSPQGVASNKQSEGKAIAESVLMDIKTRPARRKKR
ncbi:hypothetical protein R5R35_010389 [Gryllus longicercus]|uniref:Poly(A) RNA polymerase, mitochondrial n=1 Tax=Gryllus longicercus TaxID=2509291 RepID=A0AAN9Z325_9ORTH